MSGPREDIATAACARANSFLREFEPQIDLKLGRCVDYSALLRGDHQQPSTLDDLLEWATRRGRVIISGRGASGKSVLLHRATIRAADLGYAPFLIQLSKWDNSATQEWATLRENPRHAMDFLLRRFGASNHDVADAEFLPASVQKLFLLDGLNETPGSTADQILSACSEIASIVVGASIIVTDRLVRRNLSSEDRWYFAMPLPVDAAERDRLLGRRAIPIGTEALLASPFFLDRAIKGELRGSPLATIKELVESRGKLDAVGLSAAAAAAFQAYELDRSRTFDLARFVDTGRADIAKTLLEGGILVRVSSNRVTFLHHWYHDYLASKHVAGHPELWNFANRHRVLDTLTFKANSFDAISFVLELLHADVSGEFLQAVYDWNPYAAGYALAGAGIDVDDVPRDVRLIILSMLGERQFDRHFHSAQRAKDALDLLHDTDAKRLRSAGSLEELLDIVANMRGLSKEFAKWQRFFTARHDPAHSVELVEGLVDDNSMIGWAAANVLKRLQLSNAEKSAIGRAAVHPRAVVRWRAVHAMGGFATDDFVSQLLSRLDGDDDESVQYGALRSLIEIASRDSKLLPHVVEALIDRLTTITASSRLLGELSRAVFLSKECAPTGWSQQISRIFYSLLDRAHDTTEADGWSKLASRLRVHHRSEPRVAA